MVSKKDFHSIFLNALQEISKYITDNVIYAMSIHNAGYSRSGWDLLNYYKIEWGDYYRAYEATVRLTGKKNAKICDCGGFIGMYALVMVKLGFDVTMVEAVKYYDVSLKGLYKFLERVGVKIIDHDMFDTETSLCGIELGYDMVFSMAVIEHYPYSLKRYFENLVCLAKGGFIYVMAPNIAVLHKRFNLMFHGITPLADIGEVYGSVIPFTGHHHEMTMRELEQLVEICGGTLIEKSYDTNYYYVDHWRKVFYIIIQKFFPSTREALTVIFKKSKNRESYG